MNSFNLIALSIALASAGFAAQVPSSPSTAPAVIQLAPVVVEATRLPSAMEVAQPALDALKAEATTAPTQVEVPLTVAGKPTRDGARIAASGSQRSPAVRAKAARAL